jgi:hypothetical protein
MTYGWDNSSALIAGRFHGNMRDAGIGISSLNVRVKGQAFGIFILWIPAKNIP